MRRQWQTFGAWVVAGGLLTFAILDIPGYGLFVLPVAVLAIWLVSRRARWPEVLGLVAGVGALAILVAFLNRDYRACPSGPVRLSNGETFSCGGLPPLPWLVVGAALVVIGVLAYVLVTTARLQASTDV